VPAAVQRSEPLWSGASGGIVQHSGDRIRGGSAGRLSIIMARWKWAPAPGKGCKERSRELLRYAPSNSML
jgi:hypothetical protein